MFIFDTRSKSHCKVNVSSSISDWVVLSLAVGGILLNVLYVFDDPINLTATEKNYESGVAALYAATAGREGASWDNPVFAMR